MSVIFKFGNPQSTSTNLAGYSYRASCVGTTFSAGNILRVAFMAAATGAGSNFVTTHCSIGLTGASTPPNADGPMLELKFAGASGFNIAPGTFIVSDWLNLSYGANAHFIVVMDITSGGTKLDGFWASGASFIQMYFKAASTSFSSTSVSGFTTDAAGQCSGVAYIESLDAYSRIMPVLEGI